MKRMLIQWHRALVWVSFFAVLCWALSGITHPVMAWFGPQANKMMPPPFKAEASHLQQLESIVDKLPVEQAAIVKIVASANGPILQITENETSPRRYFALSTGAELINQDQKQAAWLTTHYLGTPQESIASIRFVDSFSDEYPSVNRLLPVYKVETNNHGDKLTAYIYTETGVLAALNNPFKASMQTIFRVLHTWSWLDATGFGRVLIVSLLIITLLTMAASGLYMVLALPRRKIPKASRRWHRRMGYILWLPLLGWSASGFYHLLQAEYVQSVSGVRLLDPVQLNHFALNDEAKKNWKQSLAQNIPENAYLNAITLTSSPDNKPLYRLGIASPMAVEQPEKPTSAHAHRHARFKGQSLERSAVYIDAYTATVDSSNDRSIAQALALSAISKSKPEIQEDNIGAMKLVTHFGPDYDFRNKRLPVWQVNFIDDAKSRYFVDPVTGILVDQNRKIDRLESTTFSIVHKWNLLRPLIGPEKRDILVVTTLLFIVLISIFGLRMHLTGKRKKP